MNHADTAGNMHSLIVWSSDVIFLMLIGVEENGGFFIKEGEGIVCLTCFKFC